MGPVDISQFLAHSCHYATTFLPLVLKDLKVVAGIRLQNTRNSQQLWGRVWPDLELGAIDCQEQL